MNAPETRPLAELMAPSMGSVDPRKYQTEVFDLYSIAAFDRGIPDMALGSSIGSAKQVVQSGDVLLSKIVPHIRRAWVVGPTQGRRLIASGEWIVFRSERFHGPYLRHVFMSDRFHSQFMNTVAGVGGSLLRARPSQVAAITVPLPELAVQRRTADLLDRADALRAKRRAALALVDLVATATFDEMFGIQSSRATPWPQTRVSDVAIAQGGLTLSGARDSLPLRVPYLRVANVFRHRLDLTTMKEIGATHVEVAKTQLIAGDVLMVEGHGNRDEVGRAAIWEGSLPQCVHQNHIIRLRFDAAQIVPTYACFYLNSSAGRHHLLKSSKTTSGLNTISIGQVRAMPIALPPIEVQREFARRVGSVASLHSSQTRSLAQSDALLAALQHRAFTGEL